MIRKTYDWVMQWAHSPYGTWALFWLALAESSFFPVPPDVLLMALSLSVPAKAFIYAAISSVGSVLGGVVGYFLGLGLMEAVGKPILEWYGVMEKFDIISAYYQEYDAWAVAVAGFTPIPYKVFTIAAGACEINLIVFILASLVSRSARFFIVGGLIYKFGEPVKGFIDKYFNILTLVFTVLLIGGFVLLKFVL
ncbi:MAG: VTT domain-containing protein [Deltaproteobacteria bacterium]|nr:VTT domain-containing protein [Deltaproteobacteria bacterium]